MVLIHHHEITDAMNLIPNVYEPCHEKTWGAWKPSGRVSDSKARGRGFDNYSRHVVSLSKDTFTPPKVLVIPRKL